MEKVTLVRTDVLPEGAFGVLIVEGVLFATCEHTYDEGGRQVVKIPPGRWECRKSFFNRGKYTTFEIMVPGHSRLLFHKGNIEDDSEGCVLVGEKFGMLGEQRAVLNSRSAWDRFRALTRDTEGFPLEVRVSY